MDIGLDSWMEEHLTKTAGLLGFMPGPAIFFFNMYLLNLLIPPFQLCRYMYRWDWDKMCKTKITAFDVCRSFKFTSETLAHILIKFHQVLLHPLNFILVNIFLLHVFHRCCRLGSCSVCSVTVCCAECSVLCAASWSWYTMATISSTSCCCPWCVLFTTASL